MTDEKIRLLREQVVGIDKKAPFLYFLEPLKKISAHTSPLYAGLKSDSFSNHLILPYKRSYLVNTVPPSQQPGVDFAEDRLYS
jgi:hypothetical protein